MCRGVILSCLLLTSSIYQSTSESLDSVYFSNHLTILTNDVLGVQYMQDILNQHEYDTIPTEDGEALIDTLKNSLQYKFQNAIAVTNELVEIVRESFQSEMQYMWPECCEVSLQGIEENPRFKQKTDNTQLCSRVSGAVTSEPHFLSERAFEEIKRVHNEYPDVLWQFFGDENGVAHQYPSASAQDCDSYDPRYRPWYVEAATPMPKDVVIVIDRSGSMATMHKGRTLMNIAKEAAKTVLGSMNQNDRVGLVSFSTEASSPEGGCHSERLAQASALNSIDLEEEINKISPAGNTDYSKALNAAFDLIEKSPFPANQTRNQVIIFLTDGLPTDNNQTIMETLLRRNEATMFKIALLTFGFGENIDENTEILLDIALQNYQKYGLTPNNLAGDRTIGVYTYVADPDKLRVSMATYYNYISDAGSFDEVVFTVPYVDAFGAGLLTSILKPVRIDGKLKGVVGTDIPAAELFEDVTYFKEGEYSYAFLFDGKDSAHGRTLRHPLLPLPQAVTNDFSIYVHITTLERAPEFEEYVYKDAIRGGEGKRTFVADKIIARGDTFGEGVTVVSVSTTYYWRQIEETSLIAVLAIVDEEDKAALKQQEVIGYPFIYHRIDLWTPFGATVCNHVGNYAIGSSSVVFLTTDAFVERADYLAEQETSDLVQVYSDHMNDNDASRQNIFRSGIRDNVVVTHFIDDMWLKEKNDIDEVVIRYIGTTEGVLRFYPGFIMNKNRDYTVEQWFAQAVRDKDSIIITTSTANLFELSSRPTLTLSKAITYRASSKVFGVMGMDVTIDFFYNQMIDVYPECQQKYNCFVMDRSGYLLAHHAILSGSSNTKRRHVIEEERLFSKEMIDDDIMVRKACINYQDIKRQYYYEVIEIEGGVIDKLTSSGCLQYRLQFIPNTNAVFVIISSQLSCNNNCYCSTVNCVSEDAHTCECPCAEDEQSFDYCDFEYDVDQNSIPSCTPPLFVVPSDDDAPSTEGLQPCIETDCSSKSQSSCSSSAVCEMCDTECKDILENCGEQPTSPPNTTSSNYAKTIVITVALLICVLFILSLIIIKRERAKKMVKNRKTDQETRFPNSITETYASTISSSEQTSVTTDYIVPI